MIQVTFKKVKGKTVSITGKPCDKCEFLGYRPSEVSADRLVPICTKRTRKGRPITHAYKRTDGKVPPWCPFVGSVHKENT